MKTSFSKSVSTVEKVNKLKSIVGSGDSLAILLTADPDALASALALRRLFWRKVQRIHIVCTNRIDRADNLALVNLLDIPLSRFRSLKNSEITKWALVDSQPSHNEQFAAINFDIIIDHHPPSKNLDILVQIADFFLKMAEATWSIVSGVYDRRLIVIFRNADFRRHAGNLARELFGEVGSAGGHKDSARAEIPLENIGCGIGKASDCRQYVLRQIRNLIRAEN